RSQFSGTGVYHGGINRARSSDVRIRTSLNPDRRVRTVSGMHNRVIREAEEHIADRREKHVEVSAGQVRPADRPGEERVAHEQFSYLGPLMTDGQTDASRAM